MPEVKEFVCVNCPKGCRVSVTLEGKEVLEVKGYSCPKGKKYGEEEAICPMRVITSTVKINHGTLRVLPVMSSDAIPLEKMDEAMEEIRKIQVEAPIQMNDIIQENFLGCGVNLIASRSMNKQ